MLENERNKLLASVLNRMVFDLIGAQRPGYDRENDNGFRDWCSYPFIPMDHTRLIFAFEELRKRLKDIKGWSGNRKKVGNKLFLDAGCGPGNVMAIANAVGLCHRYHGIEYFDETYKRAQAWLGVEGHCRTIYKLFKDDILKFNKYKNYDIIYFYCPFSDARLQRRFEERLEDEMKVGAILIAQLKQSHSIQKDYRFKKIKKIPGADNVFIKVKKGPRKKSQIKRSFLAGGCSVEKEKLYREKYDEFLIDHYKNVAQR